MRRGNTQGTRRTNRSVLPPRRITVAPLPGTIQLGSIRAAGPVPHFILIFCFLTCVAGAEMLNKCSLAAVRLVISRMEDRGLSAQRWNNELK